MAFTAVFGGVPVADLAAALTWWERLLGRPPDMRPNDIEAAWQLTDTGWVYVVLDAERAGKALLTVLVDDLPAHVSALADRGIVAGPIETVAGVVRTTEVLDPDGNRVQFGEPLGDGAS